MLLNQPNLTDYLKYNNPNVAIIRTGQPGDEYVSRNDSLPVIHNLITLLEIPSERFGVRIQGFVEVERTFYEKRGYLEENEILVSYPSGIVMFHPTHEGKTFWVEYEGRGVILLSSDRVYMMYQKDPSVLVTLTDFANQIKQQIKTVNTRIKKYEEVAKYTLDIAEKARIATDQAIDATEKTTKAIKEAYDSAASTKMVYKFPVREIEDLESVYPNPENGWRVMVEYTGDIFRFDGVETKKWQLIENWTGKNIPYASDIAGGLLKNEDYNDFVIRSIGISIPKVSIEGIQNHIIQSPLEGLIYEVVGFCLTNESDVPMELSIEKISFEDFSNDGVWTGILDENIIFEPGKRVSTNQTIQDEEIKVGDLIRITSSIASKAITGITVQININTSKNINNNMEE